MCVCERECVYQFVRVLSERIWKFSYMGRKGERKKHTVHLNEERERERERERSSSQIWEEIDTMWSEVIKSAIIEIFTSRHIGKWKKSTVQTRLIIFVDLCSELLVRLSHYIRLGFDKKLSSHVGIKHLDPFPCKSSTLPLDQSGTQSSQYRIPNRGYHCIE